MDGLWGGGGDVIHEDAFKSGTRAGGLTGREKGGVTLTLKVLVHTTEAPKSEKIRLIHEFSQTRRRNINLKKAPEWKFTFFFKAPVEELCQERNSA